MRYAILSDIHANADALAAVLAHMPPDIPIWFLGDAVGYYPDFAVVLDQLEQLRRSGRLQIWLKGNHDYAIHAPTIDIHDTARIAIDLTREAMTPGQRDLLAALEEGPLILPGMDITAAHARPGRPLDGYTEHVADAREAARHCTTQLCLIGHTHWPRKLALAGDRPKELRSWKQQEMSCLSEKTFHYDETMVFLNPGSVGQPRDGFNQSEGGFPHAAYAILDTTARTFTVYRVKYEIEPIKQRTCRWLHGRLSDEKLEIYLSRLDRGI
jgi:predicted phosphodiesterase